MAAGTAGPEMTRKSVNLFLNHPDLISWNGLSDLVRNQLSFVCPTSCSPFRLGAFVLHSLISWLNGKQNLGSVSKAWFA